MYVFLVILPLISALIVLFCGKYIGKKGSLLFLVGGIFVNFIVSIIIFFEIGLSGYVCVLDLYDWIDFGFFSINIGFFFDTVTAVMIFIVTFISFLVHVYSIEYMKHDPGFLRFMSYLSLFTFFMLFLVTANNFVQMFLGWEGVGLSSYLLISFWYTRVLANKAAIKAMIINKIGDLALLVSICFIVYLFGCLNYIVIFNLVDYLYSTNICILYYKFNVISLICFFLFLGAMGKSAQIGLHVWLPDAMEGPTPVSALIHAATMVTAGVFIIVRNSMLFEYSPNVLLFIGFIGSFTCLFFAIVGCFQFDIKKIVAYSTCSQLGYMFISCSVSNYYLSLFHLFNHAFFKALLFLSMGSIIHALSDEQDLRKMGGLIELLPFSYISVFIGSFALMGIPFFTGYYSKDFLLEFTFSVFTVNSLFFYIFGLLAVFFTTFYSLRLIYWVFFSKLKFNKHLLYLVNEPSIFMTSVLIILALCSLFFGYFFFEAFVGLGSNFFNNSIYYVHEIELYAEFGIFFVKYLPLLFIVLSVFCMYIYMYSYIYLLDIYMFKSVCIFFYKIINKAFFFDLIYIDFFLKKILKFSYYIMNKYIEKGFFNFFIMNYIKYMFNNVYVFFCKIYSGLIYDYIFLILFFMIFFYFLYLCILILEVTELMVLLIGVYELYNIKYNLY